MPKILLIYPPCCTPASPPYSLAHLYTFLHRNLPSDYQIKVLDLNLFFHQQKFPEYQNYFQRYIRSYSYQEYDQKSREFLRVSSQCYAFNNKRVIQNKKPELLAELLQQIIDAKADLVAFSIVYSSQAFYGYALLQELKQQGIKTVIGGPALNSKLCQVADLTLNSEVELLSKILQTKVDPHQLCWSKTIDFNPFLKLNYFVPEIVLPLKTSSSCYYKLCAFCTHHGNIPYLEYDLNEVVQSIVNAKAKKVFFIDDLISTKRLLMLAELLKLMRITWMCQLRPMKELTAEVLQTLYDAGLRVVLWGVESGSQRVLDAMKKGTNVIDVKKVLTDSKNMGISNVTYIMWGFPTEIDAEFVQTVEFLQKNKEYIDLISPSVFGLQQDAPAFKTPEEYAITSIVPVSRTILNPKITYQVSTGLSQEQAEALWRRYRKRVEKLNKYPKAMNLFREHLLCLK